MSRLLTFKAMLDDAQREAAEEAATRFLRSALVDRDLAAVWCDADPEWRVSRVTDHLLDEETTRDMGREERREWLDRNRELANDDGPSEFLWSAFEATEGSRLRREMPDFARWHMLPAVPQGDDAALVTFLDTSQPKFEAKLEALQVGLRPKIVALNVLMRRKDDRWLFAGTV